MAIDITDIANALIDALLPRLNQALPGAIQDAGLDPWPTVAEAKTTLGKVPLGLCSAQAIAKYAVTDLKGLSSLEILSATAESVKLERFTHLEGSLTLEVRLEQDLTTKARGSIRAKCGLVGKSKRIKGTGRVVGVSGTAYGTFKATTGMTEQCLTEVNITRIDLDYDDIKVWIDHIGIFNLYLSVLVAAFSALLGSAIKVTAAAALVRVLNPLLASEVPMCIGVVNTSAVGAGEAATAV
jgi:hypothetical protein